MWALNDLPRSRVCGNRGRTTGQEGGGATLMAALRGFCGGTAAAHSPVAVQEHSPSSRTQRLRVGWGRRGGRSLSAARAAYGGAGTTVLTAACARMTGITCFSKIYNYTSKSANIKVVD